jgi:hypothetical protein
VCTTVFGCIVTANGTAVSEHSRKGANNFIESHVDCNCTNRLVFTEAHTMETFAWQKRGLKFKSIGNRYIFFPLSEKPDRLGPGGGKKVHGAQGDSGTVNAVSLLSVNIREPRMMRDMVPACTHNHITTHREFLPITCTHFGKDFQKIVVSLARPDQSIEHRYPFQLLQYSARTRMTTKRQLQPITEC